MVDIANLPAFAGLSDSQVDSFLGACEPAAIPAGGTLCEGGKTGQNLYFLRRGKVRVHHGTSELAVLSAPCMIGELELLTEGTHAASVTAVEPCEGYVIAYDAVRARVGDGDAGSLKVVYNVAKTLAARLAAMDRKFLEVLEGRAGALTDLDSLKKKLFGEWG